MIFKRLSPSQRRNLMTVCGSWLKLVNEYFARDNCIVLSEDTNFSSRGPLYKTFSKRLHMTKDKRSFARLVIKTFPDERSKLKKLSHFINLIGDEIEFLTIQEMPAYHDYKMPDEWLNEKIYAKMPNLQCLEVVDEDLFGNFSFPTVLQMIKLNSAISLKQLFNIYKVKTVQTFTCKLIHLCNHSYEAVEPFIDASVMIILKEMLGTTTHRSAQLQLHPNYNFCGELKIGTSDVIGLKFINETNLLPPATAIQFENLKVITVSTFIESFQIKVPFHIFNFRK